MKITKCYWEMYAVYHKPDCNIPIPTTEYGSDRKSYPWTQTSGLELMVY